MIIYVPQSTLFFLPNEVLLNTLSEFFKKLNKTDRRALINMQKWVNLEKFVNYDYSILRLCCFVVVIRSQKGIFWSDINCYL